MKDTTLIPLSWTRIALAIVPAAWLVVQPTNVEADVPVFFGAAAVMLIAALALLMLSRALERRIAVWCLPLFGVLAWQGDHFIQASFWAGRIHSISMLWFTALFLVVFALTIVSAGFLIPYWIYKCLRIPLPVRGWALAAALIIFWSVVNSPFWFNSLSQLFFWFQLVAFMTPVAIASFLAKKYGLPAALLVAACEPEWIELLVTPSGYSFYSLFQGGPAADMNYATLRSVAAVLSYIPFLVFLVLIPIGLLRSRTKTTQVAWLLVPSLATLIALNLVPAWTLIGTASEYTFLQWGQAVAGAVLLWLPLALCVVIANAAHPSTNVETTEASA